MAKPSVDLTADEWTQIYNGLVMARASALRLSARQGQMPAAQRAYRDEYAKINVLIGKIVPLTVQVS